MDLIPSARGWWIQAFEAGDTVIVDPYTDIATGKTIISACYPFYVDGKPFAVLADIDVTTVLEIINQIEEKQFCEGFLLSASGDVITHKNSEWLSTDEGSTNLSEINDTSTLTKETGSGICCFVTPRMLVRSRFTTRSSLRRLHASCPYPTSTA